MSAKRILIVGLIALILFAATRLFVAVQADRGGVEVDEDKLAAARAQYLRSQRAQATMTAPAPEPWAHSPPAAQPTWGRIKWRDSSGRSICLMSEMSLGPIMADYCGPSPEFEWRYHQSDSCLENRQHGGKCLTRVRDRAELAPRGAQEHSHQRLPYPGSTDVDPYYRWVEKGGDKCLTVDDTDDPPWFLIYAACHDDMHAQKFMFDDEMGFDQNPRMSTRQGDAP